MDFAKDRKENIIPAHKAVRGGGYRFYFCPVCNAEVFARQGKYRVAHFAHRSGQARPECELYFPPGYIKGPLTPSTDHLDEQRETGPRPYLQLSVELEPETNLRGRRLRQWGLRLTVPKSLETHGQLQVDCGGIHKPRISLQKLSLSPQTYQADVSSPDFGVIWSVLTSLPSFVIASRSASPDSIDNYSTYFARARTS
jgi:hypothetical protein